MLGRAHVCLRTDSNWARRYLLELPFQVSDSRLICLAVVIAVSLHRATIKVDGSSCTFSE